MYKKNLINYFNSNAKDAYKWHKRSRYYYKELISFLRFNIEEDANVLEIGSGTGTFLDAVKPKKGVGLDLSPKVVKLAKKNYPELHFFEGDVDKEIKLEEKFDYIIISDLIGYLEDIQTSFENLRKVCHKRSRVLITQYSILWWPILKFFEFLRLKQKQPILNWLGEKDIANMLDLAGFEIIKKERRLLLPKYIPFLSWFANKIVANLPLFNYFCLVECFVLRPRPLKFFADKDYTVSVIIPARNEKGNIENAIKRMPMMGSSTEIIFVEGHSTDETLDEIKRVIKVYDKKNIKYFIQSGKGKYDAVKKGFEKATGDIFMILDADLTVVPEILPKFYEIISSGRGEYVQGTRLVYPMENQAMQFLNYLANKFFGLSFSWLLGQHITDTLCGTKVFFKNDYEKIAASRKFFGDFDPFGDFDFIFGASKLNLKLVELPIHYKERKYGSTNISRFRHGLILFKMLFIGIKKFKLD
ncbi:glycosyltransferase [Patescibacteria group bacterium]|nr:glycosyltransferase [Patescibacteria group bacterium]